MLMVLSKMSIWQSAEANSWYVIEAMCHVMLCLFIDLECFNVLCMFFVTE